MSSQKGIFDNAPITIECNGEKFLIAIANGETVNINRFMYTVTQLLVKAK